MDPYWSHVPSFIPDYVFQPLYELIEPYCNRGNNKKRYSCVFSDFEVKYNYLSTYKLDQAPDILLEIWKLVEQYTKEKYDYVLVHIYTSGKAGIYWHNDSEALNSSVASVSLGATRKFRLKTIGRTKGWNYEINLQNGDLLWMHGPDEETNRPSCQQVYVHSVPVESTVKEPRINLTFRILK